MSISLKKTYLNEHIRRVKKKRKAKKNPKCFRNKTLNTATELNYRPIKMLNDDLMYLIKY